MSENYLTLEQYRRICEDFDERDARSQESLALYLHHLGIALNYKDDPRLRGTHVLNPHWVTNGIYRILNSEILEQQKGEILLRDISSILPPSEYPESMHCFLFDLMRKFELCLRFPDDGSHYLIPDLLDKQEPAEIEVFGPFECLDFQYDYPVLPQGVLSRFIVRTHVMSEGLPRWRSGVIVQFGANRALVRADVQQKKVFISVSGPAAGRRQLLAIIRWEFEGIHRCISNLTPKEMVPLPGFPEVAVSYDELCVLEENGVKQFVRVLDKRVLSLDVNELLNGVDLKKRPLTTKDAINDRCIPVQLFYSYSHQDEHFRDQLETHLKLLQRDGLIATWNDRRIGAGDDWKKMIDQNLERADIILLLVSADFIASDYCYEREMVRALERHRQQKARVIPVIIRDCNWKKAPFAELQCLPRDGVAVTKWENRDSAWRNVSEAIENFVMEISNKV